MHVIIIGPDDAGLGAAFRDRSASVKHIAEFASQRTLRAAGVADAAVLVLTDVAQATAIPVARECAPDITVLVYSDSSLPEFAAPLADYIIDPAAIPPSVVVDEIS